MTTQDTPLEPVSPATVADWRRRRQASEALPPPPGHPERGHDHPEPGDDDPAPGRDHPQLANGIQAVVDAAATGSPGMADPVTKTAFSCASVFSPPREAAPGRISGPEPAGARERQAAEPVASPPYGRLAEPRAPAEDAAGVSAPARRRLSVPLPLLIILALQAVLTASLIHANTAFQDEALYLWIGHLELAHVIHGTPVPPFATYLSGAPIIYPPIGALADGIGGLAGARLLSGCFMLGATTLLWSTTSRLYGRRAALFAAGIWSVLGPTLHLGAFATFDAMSLFLIALAAWCAIGASKRHDATGWILATAGALALANAAKYASVIFDPTVIAMAWLSACPRPGGKIAARRATLLVTCLVGLLALLFRLGGRYYVVGFHQTTLTRIGGTDTAAQVLGQAWAWVGLVVVLAAVGAVVGAKRHSALSSKMMLMLLAATGLLAPLAQARVHTLTSLDKHVAFGAWFAVIAGGYALSALTAAIGPHALRVAAYGACGVGLAALAGLGLAQARALFAWPNTSALVTALRPLADRGTGHLLVETPAVAEYYLPAGAQWERWSSTWSVLLPGGQAVGSQGVGRPALSSLYAELIPSHYFSVIALNFNATPALDQRIAALLRQTPGYRVVARLPYGRAGDYVIWVDAPRAAAKRRAA